MKFIRLTLLLVVLITQYSCNQKSTTVSSKLKIEHRIFDNSNLLTNEQEADIFEIIRNIELNIGPQIAIMTIDTLNGENINEFSLKAANQLGVGRKNINDGILLVLSIKDRAVRIEVGYGLERIIKDEIAANIIKENMAPKFRENDYYGGLKTGIEKIVTLIENKKELIGK